MGGAREPARRGGSAFPLSGTALARRAAAAALVALFVLCLLWELWLAPLRPGGSLIALKALPLLLPVRGIFAGNRYTYQWSSLLILAYLAEGATRAASEHGASQTLAALEALLGAVFFAAAVAYARLTRPPQAALSPEDRDGKRAEP